MTWAWARYLNSELTAHVLHAGGIVEDDAGLDGALVLDALEGLAELLELEGLVDDAGGLDLAAIEVVDRRGWGRSSVTDSLSHSGAPGIRTEHVGLGEGAQDGDLVTEDLGRGPGDAGGIGVDAGAGVSRWMSSDTKRGDIPIDHELTTTADVVDGILQDLGGAGRLDDDVEAVGVVLLELGELGLGLAAGQLDVVVGGLEALCQVHLEAAGSGDSDVAAAVVAHELGEHQAGRAGAEHEDAGAEAGADLVEAVAGARGGLEEGGVDIGQVVELEDLAGGIGAVLGEAAVHGDTVGVEVLAEEELTAATVEALIAELAVVGGDAVADLEALDFLCHGVSLHVLFDVWW